MKKHWAHDMLAKRIKRFKNGPLLPRFLRLPTVIELGRSNINALPCHLFDSGKDKYNWKSYEAEMRKDYPIKYFIYYTLNYWFSRNIIKPTKDFKYYIISHTIRKYHLLDLRSKEFEYSYGWRDADTQMLLALMKIMENFIIEQDTVNHIVWLKEESAKDPDNKEFGWNESIKFCEDLLDIQKWWRVGRVENWKILDKKCSDKSIDHVNYFDAEAKLIKEDDEMMKKLIDMRGRMWT